MSVFCTVKSLQLFYTLWRYSKWNRQVVQSWAIEPLQQLCVWSAKCSVQSLQAEISQCRVSVNQNCVLESNFNLISKPEWTICTHCRQECTTWHFLRYSICRTTFWMKTLFRTTFSLLVQLFYAIAFTNISVITFTENLKALYLSDNELEIVPAEIRGLTSLQIVRSSAKTNTCLTPLHAHFSLPFVTTT